MFIGPRFDPITDGHVDAVRFVITVRPASHVFVAKPKISGVVRSDGDVEQVARVRSAFGAPTRNAYSSMARSELSQANRPESLSAETSPPARFSPPSQISLLLREVRMVGGVASVPNRVGPTSFSRSGRHSGRICGSSPIWPSSEIQAVPEPSWPVMGGSPVAVGLVIAICGDPFLGARGGGFDSALSLCYRGVFPSHAGVRTESALGSDVSTPEILRPHL